jgi:solute carrier family 25 iron transporter 28/37
MCLIMSGIVLTATQTRMQILNPTPSAVYNGMIQGGYRIATGEGILSLWRGMSSVVVGAGLYIWVVIRGDNR